MANEKTQDMKWWVENVFKEFASQPVALKSKTN